MRTRMLGVSFLGVVASAALVAACSAEPTELGTVGVALTASDATGATYRLTPGARLATSSDTFYDEFALDGDQAIVRIDLPPGAYTAELLDDAGHGPQWPLVRRAPDGTTETVVATLVTPMPAPLTITTGGLAALALRFEVPDLGVITFDQGAVDVSIVVVGSTPANLDVSLGGALDTTVVTVHPTAPPALPPRLPATGATGVGFTFAARISGPWTKSAATTACAPVTLTAASSHPGVADLLHESQDPGVQASFCITGDGTAAASGELFLIRSGTPTTPTFADLGAGNYQFLAFATVELSAAVFDGEHLDLRPLLGPHTLPATAFTRVAYRPGTTGARTQWYRANYAGQLTLTLAPGT